MRISIADSGIGIPSEIQRQIFDPFFSTKQQGSGLGLATSFSIMRRHEGTLDVESEPGKGAAFHLHLPASPGSPTHAERCQLQAFRGRARS